MKYGFMPIVMMAMAAHCIKEWINPYQYLLNLFMKIGFIFVVRSLIYYQREIISIFLFVIYTVFIIL